MIEYSHVRDEPRSLLRSWPLACEYLDRSIGKARVLLTSQKRHKW